MKVTLAVFLVIATGRQQFQSASFIIFSSSCSAASSCSIISNISFDVIGYDYVFIVITYLVLVVEHPPSQSVYCTLKLVAFRSPFGFNLKSLVGSSGSATRSRSFPGCRTPPGCWTRRTASDHVTKTPQDLHGDMAVAL